MAYSQIGICNLALASVGEAAIRDFDESNKRSRMCQAFYEPTRDYILAKFDWPFARKYRVINELVIPEDEQVPDKYAYLLPPDCETPRELHPRGSRQRWNVQGDMLLCETPDQVGLYYTKTNLATGEYTATFVNLLALAIAVRLAPVLTQDKALVKELYSQYSIEQREVWESDANIGNDYREHDEDPLNDTFVTPELANLDYQFRDNS